MAACEATHTEDHGDYITNRSWFIAFGIALVFGIVWAMVGESSMKLVFITAAFGLFVHAGVKTEMSARALCESGHH